MSVSLIQRIKDGLVKLGASNKMTQAALHVATRRSGVRLSFQGETITLSKGCDKVILRSSDLSLVPEMVGMHSHFFETLDVPLSEGVRVLDFSVPSTNRYRRTGIEIAAPHIAEDDSVPLYTSRFSPAKGMVVFDIGAHAGLTTVEFARMVGPEGRVFAFEPDDAARRFLAANIKRADLRNVTVLDIAVGEASGYAQFCMDGTQAAGLVDSLVYCRSDRIRSVKVMTLSEACNELDVVPDYIKSDIEGGEWGLVRGARDFLAVHRIHMSFETHRLRDGSNTFEHLAPLLTDAGYSVERLVEGQARQNFLLATPRYEE